MDEMAQAHRDYYEVHDRCQDVIRAIDALLAVKAGPVPSSHMKAELWTARRHLQNKVDHIVAVWD